MDREAVAGATLTRRELVLALVTVAAVLGAGAGFLPGSFDDPDDDPGPGTTTAGALPGEETTDALDEVDFEGTTSRAATTRTPAGATSATTATGANESSPDGGPTDASFAPTTGDGSSEADAGIEVNVTVGARPVTPPAVAG